MDACILTGPLFLVAEISSQVNSLSFSNNCGVKESKFLGSSEWKITAIL